MRKCPCRGNLFDVLVKAMLALEHVSVQLSRIVTAGRIDVLINNAAIARYGPLLEQPLDEIREVLDADVIGLLALSQVRAADMRALHPAVMLCVPSHAGMLSHCRCSCAYFTVESHYTLCLVSTQKPHGRQSACRPSARKWSSDNRVPSST